MNTRVRGKLAGLISLIVAFFLLSLTIFLKSSQLPPVQPSLISPTSTLTIKNLQSLPTRIFPSATPVLSPENTGIPMDDLAIYLIQLQGQPDPEQRRLFMTALTQTLKRPVEVVYEYGTVYNGLAVKLTPQEAHQAAKLEQVQRVVPDAQRFPQDQSKRDTGRSTP